jgi:hypothetical protein
MTNNYDRHTRGAPGPIRAVGGHRNLAREAEEVVSARFTLIRVTAC